MTTPRPDLARWADTLLHWVCLAGDGVPGRSRLDQVTGAERQQVDHYWSEREPGLVPCVEAHLGTMTLTYTDGTTQTLWMVEQTVQVMAAGKVCTLQRGRSYADEAAARADFTAHQGELRDQLAVKRSEVPPRFVRAAACTPS